MENSKTKVNIDIKKDIVLTTFHQSQFNHIKLNIDEVKKLRDEVKFVIETYECRKNQEEIKQLDIEDILK